MDLQNADIVRRLEHIDIALNSIIELVGRRLVDANYKESAFMKTMPYIFENLGLMNPWDCMPSEHETNRTFTYHQVTNAIMGAVSRILKEAEAEVYKSIPDKAPSKRRQK